MVHKESLQNTYHWYVRSDLNVIKVPYHYHNNLKTITINIIIPNISTAATSSLGLDVFDWG